MQFLCIGVNGCADEIVHHINCELEDLKNKKINYTINEIDSEGSTSVICSIDDDDTFKEGTLQP